MSLFLRSVHRYLEAGRARRLPSHSHVAPVAPSCLLKEEVGEFCHTRPPLRDSTPLFHTSPIPSVISSRASLSTSGPGICQRPRGISIPHFATGGVPCGNRHAVLPRKKYYRFPFRFTALGHHDCRYPAPETGSRQTERRR